MPMVLRPRKSRRVPGNDGSDSGSDEVPRSALPRQRSTRLHGSRAGKYEDGEDSDSDPGQTLEPQKASAPGAAEEEDMHIQSCSILLNRLESDRDEMNRRSGIPKPTSRIPTFHKKAAPPAEAARPKSAEVKERFLPAPSVRSPFPGADETAPRTAAPRTFPESYLTASPRPALRPDRGPNQRLPDQSRTRTWTGSEPEEEEEEEEKEAEAGESHVYTEEEGTQREEEGEEEEESDGEGERTCEASEAEGITEEPPPWENKTLEQEAKEFQSSSTESESQSEGESEGPKIQSLKPDQRRETEEPAPSETKAAPSETKAAPSETKAAPSETKAAPSETKAALSETKAAPSETKAAPSETKAALSETKSWSCCSLLLRCLVPLLLLLFVGFSQHLWLYGLPRSVAQLSAQLHLHWLQGIVPESAPCSSRCRVSLVESIPVGLYPSAPAPLESIAQSWLRLLDRANHSVDVAAFYVTLRSADHDPTDTQGRQVFEKMKSLKSRGVSLRMSVNAPQTRTDDTEELKDAGAEVKEVNLSALTGGIIHTKLWAVDQRHLYVGSANMDWRSLTQVKEVGLAVEDCSCLAQDVSRVFEVYWTVGGANGSLPPYWPARLSALSSAQNPLHLEFNGVPARVYLSSAPPQLSTRGRTDDLEAILSVIDDAQQFIHVSVMDFIPEAAFSKPPRFWPPLDSALRSASCSRGLKVRLLVSCWPHSPSAMFVYLQSLLVLTRPPLNCDLHVKVFSVPSTPEQMKIPFARVNHAKFMVTDRVLYVGTSNWSGDYFTQTAGVGLVVNQTGSEPGLETLRTQADRVFLRDWTSKYSTDLSVDQTNPCPLVQT